MSEEFKKEEINGEAAEENQSCRAYRRSKSRNDSRAERGRDGKTAGNRRSAEGGRKETTTYSWVNPKISGKTGEENNSASYTGKPDPSEAKAEQTSSAKTEHYQYQSQTQSA